MRTAFYNMDCELVVDRNLIVGTYAKRRLGFDLLANFPFEVFTLAAGYSYASPVFSAWKMFRMLRFFRMRKLHPPLLVEVNSSGQTVLVYMFPLMTHWVACGWFAIGLSSLSDDVSVVGEAARADWDGGTSWLMRPNYGGLRLGRETNVQAYVSSQVKQMGASR